MSDPGLRICWLDKVWMALVKGLGGFFDEESSPRDKPAVISLSAHLPLASSCPSQQFDMDHSQCVLPIAEDMLLDFWRFVPFHKLLRPPEGLIRPDRFRQWIGGASFGRSPLPSEDLVVTSDGSFNPLDGSAGWGITLSVRGSEQTNVPGQLTGCAYGPLDVLGQLFSSALLSLGAYAAETVGLLWAALMLFQLRWRRGTVFRCDSTSALHAMHGQVDGKPHSVCHAARSLHLALMCLLGSGMRYEHVAGHSGIVPMSWRTLWLPEVLKALVVVAFSDWTFPAASAVTALPLTGFHTSCGIRLILEMGHIWPMGFCPGVLSPLLCGATLPRC